MGRRGRSGVGSAIVLGLVLSACGGSVDASGSGGNAGVGASGGSGGSGAKTALPTGYYFFLFDVDYLSTQLQTYVHIDVSPAPGTWKGVFTDANRREALNSRPGCPSCALDAPICALVPSPRCVKASEKQGALDEYVDFLPEPDPPGGYTFVADGSGCWTRPARRLSTARPS